MPIEEALQVRLCELIEDSIGLRRGNEHGQVLSTEHEAKCKGWIAAALNIVKTICPNADTGYNQQAQKIADTRYGYGINRAVGDLGEVLSNLVHDFEAGLVSDFANRVRAEVFDDFLDHAKHYLAMKRKNEAGVIAGVVFEDSIRRVCDKYDIGDKGEEIDLLISELVTAGKLSQAKAKRARAAAHVRTKATHAQWDEFDDKDVSSAIEFAEELILKHLDPS